MSFPQIAALALTRFAAWHQHSDEQIILGPRVCHACYRGKPNTGKREERVPPGFQDKRANIHTTLVLDCDVKDLAVLMQLVRQQLWVSCPVWARSSASTHTERLRYIMTLQPRQFHNARSSVCTCTKPHIGSQPAQRRTSRPYTAKKTGTGPV